MRWQYDAQTDTLDVKLADGEVAGSHRLGEDVVVDIANDGQVVAIEVLGASARLPAIRGHVSGRIEVGPEPLLAFRVSGPLADEEPGLRTHVEQALTLLEKIIGLVPA